VIRETLSEHPEALTGRSILPHIEVPMPRAVAVAVSGLIPLLILLTGVAGAGLVLGPAARVRLGRGEVLFLDALPPGGLARPDQGGTAVAAVHAAPETVWGVLVGYAGHRDLYPRVVAADVLESVPGRTLVRYTIRVGPFSFGLHVNNFPDPVHHRIDWRLDRTRANGLFRDTWGYWQIEPSDDGVVLTYAMAARTALPAFLTRGTEREGLVGTVQAVRERAEREERRRAS
jgi:hypothetical protein